MAATPSPFLDFEPNALLTAIFDISPERWRVPAGTARPTSPPATAPDSEPMQLIPISPAEDGTDAEGNLYRLEPRWGAAPIQERAAVVRTICQRLKTARGDLCGIDIATAAKFLGVTAKELAAIERGTDIEERMLPPWLLVRAAKRYEVSVDYLVGQSDDFEAEARLHGERGTGSWIFDEWQAAHDRDMESVVRLGQRVDALGRTLPTIAEEVLKAGAALERFRKLNWRRFDDMRGGDNLVSAVERSVQAAEAIREIVRYFLWESKRPDIPDGVALLAWQQFAESLKALDE